MFFIVQDPLYLSFHHFHTQNPFNSSEISDSGKCTTSAIHTCNSFNTKMLSKLLVICRKWPLNRPLICWQFSSPAHIEKSSFVSDSVWWYFPRKIMSWLLLFPDGGNKILTLGVTLGKPKHLWYFRKKYCVNVLTLRVPMEKGIFFP